jgi:hypothetical protein
VPKVAVVAVHGVADQKPGESARQIADLLNSEYGPFAETPIRIARKPMVPGNGPLPDAGLRYMRHQLEGYQKDATEKNAAASVYDSVRLEGTKADGTPVHVFEVYWADLSRAGTTAVRLFGELYQILLHLPSLGRNALKAAKESGAKRWSAAYALQSAAVWIFTIAIPLLNLAMFSLALVAVSAEVPDYAQAYVAAVLITAAITVAIVLLLRDREVSKTAWYLVPFICLGAGVAAWAAINFRGDTQRVLGIEAAVIAAGLTIAVGVKYSSMKNEALWFTPMAAALCSGAAIFFLAKEGSAEAGTYSAALHTVQVMLVPLELSWALLLLLIIFASVAGVVAALSSPKGSAAHRVAWTARFSIGLPVALFSTLTITVWLLLTRVVTGVAPTIEVNKPNAPKVSLPMPFKPLHESGLITNAALNKLFSLSVPPHAHRTLQDFMHDLVVFRARFFPYFALAILLFVLAAAWAAAPSILYEIRNPKNRRERAVAGGKWLSNGLPFVAVAGDLAILAIAGIVVTLIVPAFRERTTTEAWLNPVDTIIYIAAAGVGALLTVKFFLGPLRSAIDIILDVDNYMRESPKKETPRARIAERFVSLLRPLIASGYDPIVFVAHSQGTVIAADALRYLENVEDPDLPRRGGRIRLFTMGSPLKQLYAAAFPYYYDWIDTPRPPYAPPACLPPAIHSQAPPVTSKLFCVDFWSNAYRSSDYVGRYLWLGEDYENLWDAGKPQHEDNPSTRRQFCAGAGAHTHYWDSNGASIAAEIGKLIGPGRAANPLPPPRRN